MIKLGLIGAGRWGRNYIRTVAGMKDAVLAAVASRNPETAALVPDGCRIEPDWRKLIEAGDLDGVIIATPPGLHAEMAKAAIEAGLPVLIEKPLTMSFAQADELKRLAGERKVYAMVDHTHLFNPAYRSLVELGEHLGRLRAIWGEAGNQGPFRKDANVLWDWGCHDIAMCLDLTQRMPERVKARMVQNREVDGGIGQEIEIDLIFPGDVPARIDVSNLQVEKKRRLTVYFDLATLVFDDLAPSKLTLYPPAEPFERPEDPGEAIQHPSTMPLELAVREFADAIRLKDVDFGNLGHAVAVVAVLDEAQKVIRS